MSKFPAIDPKILFAALSMPFKSNGMDSSSPYHFGVDAPEW